MREDDEKIKTMILAMTVKCDTDKKKIDDCDKKIGGAILRDD